MLATRALDTESREQRAEDALRSVITSVSTAMHASPHRLLAAVAHVAPASSVSSADAASSAGLSTAAAASDNDSDTAASAALELGPEPVSTGDALGLGLAVRRARSLAILRAQAESLRDLGSECDALLERARVLLGPAPAASPELARGVIETAVAAVEAAWASAS